MVDAGVVAALNFSDRARAGVEITETEPPTSIRAQLLADVIAEVFEQINQLITLFDNLLRARAGQPPVISADTVSISDTDSETGASGRR